MSGSLASGLFSAGASPSQLGLAALFGSGADGNVVISSGTTTITRDMQYGNLTISGSGALVTNGYRVFVSGVLDLSQASAGAIKWNGNAPGSPSGATGGAAGSVMQGITVPGELNGGSPTSGQGGTGTTGTGTAGTGASGADILVGGNGGGGGAGGNGTNSAASGAGAVSFTYLIGQQYPSPLSNFIVFDYRANTFYLPVSGYAGGGGGCGGGDGTNAGAGGGAGGRPGGTVYIAAATIYRGANAAAGIIQAKGAAGTSGANASAGNTGGGGGGGGGAGGFIWLLIGQVTGGAITNALDASGGASGAGGNGFGTGLGATSGAGGNSGMIQKIVLNPASFSASAYNQSGSTSNSPSGATGGASAAGATLQVNL